VVGADVYRFGTAETLREAVRFGEAHLRWVDGQALLGPGRARELCCYRDRLAARLAVWRLAMQAAEADEDDTRCGWLGMLRERIGVRAYNAGRLPPLIDPSELSRAD
jgi:hypothetical protein